MFFLPDAALGNCKGPPPSTTLTPIDPQTVELSSKLPDRILKEMEDIDFTGSSGTYLSLKVLGRSVWNTHIMSVEGMAGLEETL